MELSTRRYIGTRGPKKEFKLALDPRIPFKNLEFAKQVSVRKITERVIDKFSNFLDIWFWPVIGPQGVFWDEKERNQRKQRKRI